jgi:hypothetical protein
LEKNRIYHAALGCLITILLSVSFSHAQDAVPDSSFNIKPEESVPDTVSPESQPDSILSKTDNIFEKKFRDSTMVSDSTQAGEYPVVEESTHTETVNPTSYYRRTFLAKGIADDLKDRPGIFMSSPGPVGSPQIPLHYLNVPGIEIMVNDHPYLCNDIYRPYTIGSDLNSLPWEILNTVNWNDEFSLDNRMHLDLGRPSDDENRSDVEIFRGPYGYNANRWRFFRPFAEKTYGYFSLGFKKSNGYVQNSDYDAFHVAGGGSRVVMGGLLEIDLWKYRAKSGLNSYDFLTPQILRHSRTTRRYEVSYSKDIDSLYDIRLSGMYQRNGLIAKDIGDTLSIENDIGGGTFSVGRNLAGDRIDFGMNYYRLRTFKLDNIKPALNIFEYFGKFSGERESLRYRGEMKYSWNGADHGEFLPSGFFGYSFSENFSPFASISRSRRIPDLNLLYFNEEIDGLGLFETLSSYKFESSYDLNFPVTTKVTVGNETEVDWGGWRIGISYIKIKDQIYLSYSDQGEGVHVVTPVNFDDELIELFGTINFKYSLVDGEAGGTLRRWKDRYFADNLEKGPAAVGFGRLSASRSFFLEDLFLGGSLEFRGSTRQDYRSINAGLTEWFGIINGRIEFRYKDFIFWWNDDNIINSSYTTWWPYPESARAVWWGFRWRFYD